MRLGDVEVAGSSPEMLVRVEGRRLTTLAIAGTRRREPDPEREADSDIQLLSDEKELAEHVMLVDLARNDIGKVLVPGSVNVAELMKLVKYSHVKHLVSRVEGTLRADCGPMDALVSVFPAGTVTGAPKLRAMEIIYELEPFARGPYAGASGTSPSTAAPTSRSPSGPSSRRATRPSSRQVPEWSGTRCRRGSTSRRRPS
jgi:anthranilate synthase component 1